MATKGEVQRGEPTIMPIEASCDVWQIAQSGSSNGIEGTIQPCTSGKHKVAAHPAMFPVALPIMAMECMSAKGDVVYDPFGGAGTTLLAAERTGRIAMLSEMTPAYCDLAIRRWEAETGFKAKRSA